MPNAAEPVMEDTKGDRCPRCLQTVPPKASRCPGCGQPIGSMRSLAFAIGIAGLVVLVFAMIVMYRLVANEDAANAPVPVDGPTAGTFSRSPASQPCRRAGQAGEKTAAQRALICSTPQPRGWRVGALPQPPDVFQGPVDENRFAVDGVAFDETPGAAVAGGTAMVAQHEVLARRDALLFPGDAVAIVLGDVALGQQPTESYVPEDY